MERWAIVMIPLPQFAVSCRDSTEGAAVAAIRFERCVMTFVVSTAQAVPVCVGMPREGTRTSVFGRSLSKPGSCAQRPGLGRSLGQ